IIFSIITKNNLSVEKLNSTIYDLLLPIQNLKYHFGKIEINKPKIGYMQIFQLFNDHDKDFFDKKMNIFQSEILKIFNDFKLILKSDRITDHSELNIDFIIEFIIGLIKDLSIEFNFVYHR